MSSVDREGSVTKVGGQAPSHGRVGIDNLVGQAVGFDFVISPTTVEADEARRGAGRVLGPCRKAVPIVDHEVEVADARRVEARIVDLAQAAAFQSKPNLAQGGVTRAEAAFVCRQPIGLAARTAGRHGLSLD
jgi:hypothetical protein